MRSCINLLTEGHPATLQEEVDLNLEFGNPKSEIRNQKLRPMPTFPKYHGEMPKCLNPLKPHHWFLLLSWIYFRPSGLKYYLYQADPELHRADSWKAIFRMCRKPAYRNLFVTALIVVAVLFVLIDLSSTLLCEWMLGEPVNLWLWALDAAGGVAVVAVLFVGVIFNTIFGMAGDGVALGVVLFVALGVMLGVAFGVGFGVAVGVGFGMAVGVTGGVMGDVTIGVAGGVAFGVMFGVFDMAFGVAFSAGVLRFVFYPFQVALALCHRRHGVRHPLEWDQLLVLPLPCSLSMLAQKLSKGGQVGLREAATAGCNPFQRWIMQKVFSRYLHNSPDPLSFLYALLTNPDLTEYVNEPDSIAWKGNISVRHLLFGELALKFVEADWKISIFFSDRLVWRLTLPLRELQRTPLTDFAGMIYDLLKAETFFAENHYDFLDEEKILEDLSDEEIFPAETYFAGITYDLLDEEIFKTQTFDFSVYADIYNNLSTYSGGEEISWSFTTIANFLSYRSLEELAGPAKNKAYPTFHDSIRPTVLATLDRLKQVSAEIATYRDSTNRIDQQAVLLRAADALKNLSEYVSAEVITPEQYLLQRIIRQWWVLVTEEGNEDSNQA